MHKPEVLAKVKAIEAKGGPYFADTCDGGSGKPRWRCNCPVCCVLGGHNRDPRPHRLGCECKSCEWRRKEEEDGL